MAPVRRAAAAVVAPKPAGGSVNFGDDSFYSGGLGLPEGDYALEFTTQMFQPTKQNGQPSGQPFLCVMMTAYPLAGGDVQEHPLSCGQKAHLSFVPSEDGKGFDAVPGGPAIGMNDSTNWSLFRKSMVDCGLPKGILANDLSIIDGIWVHTQNVPEPESRKNLGSRTGEAALNGQEQQQNRGPKMIPQVSEIKDDGKPWEGTGGLPANVGDVLVAAPAAAPRAVARRGAVAPAPAAAPAAVARPAGVRRPAAMASTPVEEPAGGAEVSDEDITVAAINGISGFLAQPRYVKGCTKVALRTGAFAAVGKAEGEDMAQAVIDTYFISDEALNTVLGEMSYISEGGQIKKV